MSKRNKLLKFSEVLAFPNVFENFDGSNPRLSVSQDEYVDLKGTWSSFFKNDNPIILELACGRGEYSLNLARRYPDKNFIGVDIKGARIWQGAKIAIEESLTNVCFIRTRIEQLQEFIGAGEISEIWITFPDPFLKKKKSNRRLTSMPFLNRYRNFLKKAGAIHLKTDSTELYEFTHEVVLENNSEVEIMIDDADIYKTSQLVHPDLDIKTYYERMHLANQKSIKYLQLRLK